MTSAPQMSSRKPPVRQSTFGFPDDSASPRVGTTSTSSHLFSPTPPPAASTSTQPSTRNLKLETHLPLPCLSPCLSWLILTTSKNVEKLSFQARLNCLYRQSENFLTTPKFNILPPPPASILRTAPGLSPLSPSHPWRPVRLGALQKMHEAFFSPALCLRELRGRQSRPSKNVEKLSFGPHRLACTSRPKKYFHPHFQHFSAPKLSNCPPPVCAFCTSCAHCGFGARLSSLPRLGVLASFVGGLFSSPSPSPPQLSWSNLTIHQNVEYPNNPGLSHLSASHKIASRCQSFPPKTLTPRAPFSWTNPDPAQLINRASI